MIAKCVLVLAIVAQINAAACNYGCANQRCASQPGRTRNVVARGKYPVVLSHCGPAIDGRIPVTSSHVQTPVQCKPTIRLPANIPCQKTVAHSCTCYKTIVRPRVHQQLITVPSIQRYIETVHTPVVENIHYEGCPINCPDALVNRAGCVSAYPAAPACFTAPMCC